MNAISHLNYCRCLNHYFHQTLFCCHWLKKKNKVGLGSGGHEDLERAIRTQANFAEYIPLGVILIACLELNGAPWWLVAIPGVSLIIGRLIHAKGMNTPPPDFSKRVLGMKFTFFTLIALAALNLGWSLRYLAN